MKCFVCGKNHKSNEDFFKCVEKNKNNINWDYISEFQTLSEEFIEKFEDRVNWNYISKSQNLSEKFIEKFQDKVNWGWISKFQNLSEKFIEKFQDKVDWYYISKTQNLSEKFIEKFQDKVDLNIIDLKKKNYISIYDYSKKYNLKIKDGYLYAFRNHRKNGTGSYKNNSNYKKGIYYRDWHCDLNPNNENSYGFGIWPEGNTKVKVKIEDWGTAVFNDKNGKARVWGFMII